MHQAWDVEAYSFGFLFQNNFVVDALYHGSKANLITKLEDMKKNGEAK